MNATEQAQLERVAALVLARTEMGLSLLAEGVPAAKPVPVRDALTGALWVECPDRGQMHWHENPFIVSTDFGDAEFAPRTFDFGSGEFSGRVGKAAADKVWDAQAMSVDEAVWVRLDLVAQRFNDPATLNALEAALKGVKP